MFKKKSAGERGFTLIETLAALSVFSVMTLGITPLLISSIRGTALAKSQTVAKNLASEAMERLRGLPYYDTSQNRDLLDQYFPNLGTGYDPTPEVWTFTTTCTSTSATPSGSGARACPSPHIDGTPRIPPGFTMTFVARFVKPTGLSPETFKVVQPPGTYDSAVEANSLPPAQLIEMSINVVWMELGKRREFGLYSLVGERRLSELKAAASANVDHVFSVTTAYKDVLGTVSGMAGTGGSVTSEVEIKAIATAFSNASAGQLLLSRKQTATEPGAQLGAADGARASLRAPLNAMPAPIVSEPTKTIIHPALAEPVGFITDTVVNETSTPTAGVQVVNGFPRSVANLATTSGVGLHFWADNQAEPPDTTGENPSKYFSVLDPMFSVQRPTGALRVNAKSYAEATSTTPVSGRKVEATAEGFAPKFVLMPVTYALDTKGVVVIDNFKANVSCKATGSSAGAVAAGSWSATLTYWRDNDPTDNLAVGRYSDPITVSGNTLGTVTSDPLATIRAANPLVYDSGPLLSGADGDVYLFSDPAAGKRGYLNSWSSTFAMESSASADTATVSMPYAINIVTAKTNSANEESIFKVSIGKLSCRAEDHRD